MKIYHNPRCSKSRAGLAYLKTKDKDIEIIEYLKDKLTEDDLKRILMLLDKKASEMVRTQEDIYKKELRGKQFTDDEWVKIIIENPRLLQRPIVVGRSKGVHAIPPENMDVLF